MAVMQTAVPVTDHPASGKVNQLYLLTISLTAALGGLLFGFDFSVISGGIHLIREYFQVGELGEGFLGASLYIGCIAGAAIAGKLSDRYGRKRSLAVSAVLFAISCMGAALSHNMYFFIVNRLIGGLGVGMASILSPLYIAEVAPGKIRGRLVSINQLAIVIGIFITYFSNYLLLKRFGNDSWRWMIGVGTIPSLLFFITSLIIPESPRWLLKRNKREAAYRIFSKIGDKVYADQQMKAIDKVAHTGGKSSRRLLFRPEMKLVLTIGIVLAVFQQWCGINNIFIYAPKIFAAAGYGATSQLFQTIIIGLVNFLVTILAMALVDRLGRKKLLLFGSLSLAVIYGVLGILFYAGAEQHGGLLPLILAAIAAYGISLAPVTWVMISEIFPNDIRGVGMSVSTMCLWFACFVLVQTFPYILGHLQGAGTFWLFAVICAGGFLFIKIKVPETKGKSLEEIEELFRGKLSEGS
ncbi:MAG TPA: sugar porter family MFS transporter [Chitinophagaceae bacterium]